MRERKKGYQLPRSRTPVFSALYNPRNHYSVTYFHRTRPGTLMEAVLSVCGSCGLSSPVARDTSVFLLYREETFGFRIMRSPREDIVSNWQLQPADQIDKNQFQPTTQKLSRSIQTGTQRKPAGLFLSLPQLQRRKKDVGAKTSLMTLLYGLTMVCVAVSRRLPSTECIRP